MCLKCSHPSRKIENNCMCQWGEFEDLTTLECRKIKINVPKEVELETNKLYCGPYCSVCDMKTFKCKKCIPGKNRSEVHCKCYEGYHDNEGTTIDCYYCNNSCNTW